MIEERDATPDEALAFELGKIAGYDEGCREMQYAVSAAEERIAELEAELEAFRNYEQEHGNG